jgi:transcriptional regulator with XRE-family HTH domain
MDNLCLDAAVLITVPQGTAGEGMAKTARRVVEPVGGRTSVKAGNPVDKYVGSRVRMRRMLLGISQEELGHRVGGISLQQIQKYEKGVNRIAASRMHQIAQALGVPVGFFYEGAPMLDGKGDYQITEATGFADFLATSLNLEMVKAFGELKSEKLKRRILQLTRTIADAGTEGDPPRAQPMLATVDGDSVLPSAREQSTLDRGQIVMAAYDALTNHAPPTEDDVRLALRKIRHLGWETQTPEQRDGRDALMAACRDYIQSEGRGRRSAFARLRTAWDRFATAWTPATADKMTAEDWIL